MKAIANSTIITLILLLASDGRIRQKAKTIEVNIYNRKLSVTNVAVDDNTNNNSILIRVHTDAGFFIILYLNYLQAK
jgi:hypothetical protein